MTAALMITAILTLIGVYCLAASTTEQQIAANMHIRKQAFYNADAGVQFALASLKKDLQSGKTVLPAKTGKARAFVPAAPPPGAAAFTISRIRMLRATKEGRIYALHSTGSAENALGRIKARIRAEFLRPFTPVLRYGAFGDKKVAIQNTGVVESYNSKSDDPRHSSPYADNFASTHQADIASNKTLTGKNRAHIDGDCALGESGGSPAENKLPEDADVYGKRGMKAGRIAADPLGINSGGRCDPAAYKSRNDNGAVAASLTLKNGERETLTGAPGGADYYFTDVVLQNGAELEIDTTDGPVNIFVDGGGFKAQNGSAIHSGGSAMDLAIYANHESSGAGPAIAFHNNSSLKGLVYAPGASVVIQNKAD
ncbi:MAG TPA: pilus assembly PilX N-terminal domain-containing protein, partial [Desulfosalsimonadaceae bacterium]|nr:pilus assembly PilX N-terminal domain-containing protein [Desulfosalsimonadaceae bacterium]